LPGRETDHTPPSSRLRTQVALISLPRISCATLAMLHTQYHFCNTELNLVMLLIFVLYVPFDTDLDKAVATALSDF